MAQIYIDVDDDVIADAESFFGELGLTMSDAANMLFRNAIRIKTVPFNNAAIDDDLLQQQNAAVERFIEAVNADPLEDDPLDEILNQRINITRDLDL